MNPPNSTVHSNSIHSNRHILIVGGGIAGCMTAMRLVQRGCRVTIIERGEIASQRSGESSWAGAGILFPLLPWMYSEVVNQLTLTGASLYPALCQQLLDATGIDAEYQRSGMLLLPAFDLNQAQAWCATHAIEAQLRPTAAQLNPNDTLLFNDHLHLNAPHAGNALWLPGVGQVRPPNLLQALRKWLLGQGVTLRENTELKPLADAERLTEWQTVEGERLQADSFVVTSGAWSFELLRAHAMKLNIKPMRGQILLYRLATSEMQHIVYCEGFYLVPRKDGYLLAGSTLEDVGFDSTTTADVKDELRTKAEAILPALKGMPILKHWSGLRPGTPENLPVIGAHPTIPNLFLNTGHFRYGLTMAPCSAEIVASLVCGEQPPLDATPFAVPR